MIISASRRTDIPALYSEWFFNRIKEGYVLVRNPINIHQIGKINLSNEVVDGIVFWTKNPIPMFPRLDELKGYNYYFQFTLNSYGKDVEPNIPSKKEYIIPAFKKLSKHLGRERVIWRYDPIFFNDRYTMEYHCKYFEELAKELSDYTEKCTVSFLDQYRNTERNTRSLNIAPNSLKQEYEIMEKFAEIAKRYGLYIDTCAESIDFDKFGISHACCIDKNRFERLGDCKLLVSKDKNQRPECGCVSSIDIGAYNTCTNGCLYCYANFNQSLAKGNFGQHDSSSPLLFGQIGPDDVIKDRQVKSFKDYQMSMFN